MLLPSSGGPFTVCFTGTTTTAGGTVMMWHTAIEPQRLALCGKPVLPSHGRPVESGDSRAHQGIRRE
jgi:hypothetical protein